MFEDCKTDQVDSAWGTEGLVLTKCRVFSEAKAFSFIYYGNSEPKQSILDGELLISLWSLGNHGMTLTSLLSSFSRPIGTLSLALWWEYHMTKAFCGKREVCPRKYMYEV